MEGVPPPKISLLVHSQSPEAYINPLNTLLEPSSLIGELLAPQIQAQIASSKDKPKSYNELIDLAVRTVEQWDVQDQAKFLASHPRIGETRNLSNLSESEQQPKGATPTPGEVLKRLTILNSLYEESYPTLRYVTFVNGRPRSAIVTELETLLNLTLPAPSPSTPEPSLTSLRERSQVTHVVGSSAWRSELKRGLDAMWDIARFRIKNIGLQ